MFNNQIIAGSSGQGGSFYSYTIDQSLRVDDTASQRMYHNTVAGDAQKFTMSCWIKRTELTDSGTIMSSWNGASNFVNMYFSGDYLYCYICDNRSGFVDYNFNTASSTDGAIIFRDVGAWMHVVYAVDSTQSTATDRFTIWVNGVNTNARSGGSGNDIPLNYNMEINESPGQNFLFHNPDSASYYGSFYIAEMVYVDGTKYDADKFGEFNNGIWTPLDISTQSITYGNNGFYLDFADSSDLGKDVSGEGNHFTPGTRSAVVQNFSAHDQVLDSPTNNFPVLNPLDQNTGTLSEGNLKVATVSTSSTPNTRSTFAVNSGKWYWEYITLDTQVHHFIGIVKTNKYGGIGDDYITATPQGTIYADGSIVQSGLTTWSSSGNVLGIALDADAETVQFYLNGSSYGTAVSYASFMSGATVSGWFIDGASGIVCTGVANFGQDSTFAGATTAGGNADANGYGDFKYAPPSGFLALCSANLPEPAIGPNSATTSDQQFNTVLYTGDGTSSNAITGVGFQPDWVWIKDRPGVESHVLFDSVRNADAGAAARLSSDSTAAEAASGSTYAGVSSFDSDGFTLGSNVLSNRSARSFASWSWKAGGTAVSNTDGSITSQVSANQDAGFSIVSYTGTGTSDDYGHGLGVAPNIIFTKNRSATAAWAVYISDIGTGKYLELDQTDATTTAAAIYPSVSSTTIGVGVQGAGSITNTSGNNYISYCFANVEGFSKVGSYVGNANADGPFVYTGFRPAWVMTKMSTNGSQWTIIDNTRNTYNAVDKGLVANTTAAEVTGSSSATPFVDFVSNGFKIRSSQAQMNQNGDTFIYLAFAEAPFKYANAR